MATVTVLVCDKCGAQVDVEKYEIRHGARRASLDLCEACAAPLAELLALRPQGATGPRSVRSGRGPRQKVTTIEEIEAMKGKKKS